MKYIALQEFETDMPIGKKQKSETFILTDKEFDQFSKERINNLIKAGLIEESDKKEHSKK